MKTINLENKKVGIWGFGIVGKSVLQHAQRFTNKIQILDRTIIDSADHPNITIIQQTPESIIAFLENNEIIIPSPGIILSDYEKYAHKFIHELDIFAQNFTGKTIAITGTVGKTTITSLLSQCIINSQAGGNIGYAMLKLLDQKPTSKTAILELSSYQLHWSNHFAPDLAIWTNFYANHLDHHKNELEYFQAKCNILKQQRDDQRALIPYTLLQEIEQQISPRAQIFLFHDQQPDKLTQHPIFFIKNHQLLLQQNNETVILFDQFDQLPDITFTQNWLIILATLHLHNVPLDNLINQTKALKPEPHRIEFVRDFNKVKIYNDSKSTVWQATSLAVDRFDQQKIALFLGGLSKGTDRTPLIKHLQTKQVNVFAFGKEADLIKQLCQQHNVPCTTSTTMQEALNQYLQDQTQFNILLFSPAGTSFDLFKNFEDRGTQFKALIHAL